MSTISAEAHAAPLIHRRTRSRRSAVLSRVAGNAGEVREIIDLRTDLYRQVGKWSDGAPMIDRFDTEAGAVHIGAWKDDRLVGAARVLVRAPEQEYEHDRFLSWDAVGLPPREECVEISRLCIRRQSRHAGTMRSLLREIAWTCLISGRQYLVACATRELLPTYLRIFGARSTGFEFTHTDLGPKSHTMLYASVSQGIAGHTMPWHVWAALWAPVAVRGYRTRLLEPDAGPACRALKIAHARLASALPLGRFR